MNVSRLIDLALKQLGVLAAGENADGNEVADAVDALRGLLAQWATNRLYVHKSFDVEIPLEHGKKIYLVGHLDGDCCEYEINCCGDYVMPRPDIDAEISHISETAYIDDKPIRIIRDTADTQNASVVYSVDAPSWSFDVKNSTGKVLKIKAFSLPYKLCAHDELEIPSHYERALILTLALEIAPMFGVEPSVLLMRNQSAAIDLLKRSNSTPFWAKNDLPVGVRSGCY